MAISQYKPRHKKSPGRTFNYRKDIDNLYDRAWEAYRTEFLKHNHQCYSCGQFATVVDHLIPHKGDIVLFQKLDNHIPLCQKCHNTVTTKFDRNFVVGYPIGPKLTWIGRNRARMDVTTRVKVMPSYHV